MKPLLHLEPRNRRRGSGALPIELLLPISQPATRLHEGRWARTPGIEPGGTAKDPHPAPRAPLRSKGDDRGAQRRFRLRQDRVTLARPYRSYRFNLSRCALGQPGPSSSMDGKAGGEPALLHRMGGDPRASGFPVNGGRRGNVAEVSGLRPRRVSIDGTPAGASPPVLGKRKQGFTLYSAATRGCRARQRGLLAYSRWVKENRPPEVGDRQIRRCRMTRRVCAVANTNFRVASRRAADSRCRYIRQRNRIT